jgi:hypothetical protein
MQVVMRIAVIVLRLSLCPLFGDLSLTLDASTLSFFFQEAPREPRHIELVSGGRASVARLTLTMTLPCRPHAISVEREGQP